MTVMFTQEEIETFTERQRNIFQYFVHHTWEDTIKNFNLSGHEELSNVKWRTIKGLRWPAIKSGRPSILPEVCHKRFIEILVERSDNLRCVHIFEAVTLAQQMLAERKERGTYLFFCVTKKRERSKKFEDFLNNTNFNSRQLKTLLKHFELEIKRPENLEEIRRIFCKERDIEFWYDFLETYLHNISYLTFNADETSLATRENGHVITQADLRPITAKEKYQTHLSAMCSFSASGHIVSLLIILTNLAKVPDELHEFEDDVYFASSDSGFMTKDIFKAWCILFVSWLSLHRATFIADNHPEHINLPAILFLDSHKSRLTYEGLFILAENNVIVITFRSHTTHISQPFDLVTASPLKSELDKLIKLAPTNYAEDLEKISGDAGKERYIGTIPNYIKST